ncbi:AraC-like DNA-binding protein [Mucilaginibacter frigoritolerans]|uniref:AraC-like DNA-binding protein n=1 Tax=Mucilaginibacter frigoritolerans TaxID=652788 RepID=A0A562UC13_9SPHI|nr:AraC family transcriptional regulator [Mucilaginibacter frigoritolerans]TWJ03360.1 AraC-like DNA-binding protein [Mucilaginibacter frigoritolerans]
MQDKETSKEHQKRIETVIDYILKNINNHISLKTLADVAHYSPFYLQKVFKQHTGESPKQYIIKVRLETTLLLLVIHPHKSLKEIALDCGFSSPAVFSRAVKNYFGISPEEIRERLPKERMRLFKIKNPGQIAHDATGSENVADELDVQIKKIDAITGFYLTAPCDDIGKIQESFKTAIQIAQTNDLLVSEREIYGILSPHQGNIYKTFVAVNKRQPLPGKLNMTEIKAGKYATLRITGGIKETINAGHFLYRKWLPENGYKIADVVRFEVFTENPATIPYDELQREVYFPIEPI